MSLPTIMGFLCTIVFIVLVYKEIVNVQWAFMLIPVVGALLLGYGFPDIAGWVVAGAQGNAKMTVLAVFAVMLFATMNDVGVFDDIVDFIVKKFSGSTVMVFIAGFLVATISSLDGAAPSTVLVTVAAMLPVFKKSKIRPICLGFVMTVVIGACCLFPWSGMNLSYGAALGTSSYDAFVFTKWCALFGYAVAAGLTVIVALREKKRIDAGLNDYLLEEATAGTSAKAKYTNRQIKMRPVNLLIVAAYIVIGFTSLIDPALNSMICCALAFVVNYKNAREQQAALRRAAPMALVVGGLFMVSGGYTKILQGTGMMDGMVNAMLSILPSSLSGNLHVILAFIAVPFVFLFGSTPFIYGIIPVVGGVVMGVAPEITNTMIHAAMASGTAPYLLCCASAPAMYLMLDQLGGIKLSDYAKFTLPWAWIQGMAMAAFGLLLGFFT